MTRYVVRCIVEGKVAPAVGDPVLMLPAGTVTDVERVVTAAKDSARCRSCRAQVMFVRHELGKQMCLNYEQDAVRGNVVIVVDSSGREVCRSLGRTFAVAARAVGTPLYLSHHADCPSAGQWQRKAAR